MKKLQHCNLSYHMPHNGYWVKFSPSFQECDVKPKIVQKKKNIASQFTWQYLSLYVFLKFLTVNIFFMVKEQKY